DNGVELFAVAERHVAAGAVDHELTGDVREEPFLILGQNLLQLADACKLTAVGKDARGIDRLPELETDADEWIDPPARRRVALADRPIPLTEAADDVERFERKSRRVHLRMAAGTRDIRTVLVELLA